MPPLRERTEAGLAVLRTVRAEGIKMRYCDNCGYKLRADDAFCQQCGRKVEEMAGTGPGSQGAGHPQKNKNKVPAILISAVLILCIGGLIAWYVLKPVDKSLTEQTAKKRAEETDHADEGEDKSRGKEDGIAADSAHLSNHAYGCAIDINPQQNPYITITDGRQTWSHDNAEQYIDRSR